MDAAAVRTGGFEARVAERRVLRGGEPVALGARAFDLLMVLIDRRDRVVGKDELLSRVWPGLVVEENNLSVQISALRKVFGGEAIATVAGRGYRFTLPVERVEPDEPGERTPPLPAAATPHNLPPERSSFIGRTAEAAAVRRALGAHTLVTLTGIGGSGKTWLALHVAVQALDAFPDGVFFVDLAPLADPGLLPLQVAGACRLVLGDGARDPAERLLAALAPRRVLLVLDNCEHLLDAVAALADQLLAGAPRLVLLATSREPLAVEGEQVLQVPSLAVPAAEADDVATTDAMQLFADRGQAVQLGFALDAHNRAAVAEICRRLDSIPRAIEFAAARVAHLAPGEIADGLSDRFRLLTGGRRRIARQQTLGATLDWSHGLLDDAELGLFRRLAVFVGGFSLTAAEGVCAGDGLARTAVLDGLASLVAKSLVGTVDGDPTGAGGPTRCRMLETVRLYALDKLEAAGETAALRTRHRDHLLAVLDAVPLERLHFDADAAAMLGVEIDNVRAAADWCLADGRPDLLARLVPRMAGLWFAGCAYRDALGSSRPWPRKAACRSTTASRPTLRSPG